MDVVPVTAFILSTFEGIVPASGQLVGITFTAVALILNNLYQRKRMHNLANASSANAKRA